MKINIPTYPAGTFCIEQVGGGAGYLLLDSIIETHDDMAVYCGWTSYRIRTLNSAAARFLGVTKKEAVGRGFFDLMAAQFSQGELEEFLHHH